MCLVNKQYQYTQNKTCKGDQVILANFSHHLFTQYIGCVEEAEWACEEMKKSGIPISITMCIGPLGDFNDVSVEEVGIRLAKAGRSSLFFEILSSIANYILP